MISKIKYTAFMLLSLVFLLFCGETASRIVADRTDEYGERLIFERVYQTSELKSDILRLADRYGTKGFLIQDQGGDKYHNTYYCLPGSQKGIKRSIGIKPCTFDQITGFEVELSFKSFEELPDDEAIGELFLSGEENSAFISALSEKYELSKMGRKSCISLPLIAALVCMALFALLCLYDALSRKRDVCIALTLGRGMLSQIACFVLKDTLFYVSASPVVFALLYKVTAVTLFVREYMLFVTAQSACSALMYFVLFRADICASLKNENRSHKLLALNYILKTAACMMFISVLMISGDIGFALFHLDDVKVFKAQLGSFYIADIRATYYQSKLEDDILSSGNELIYGSNEQKVLYGYFEELKVFYEECDKRGDIFILNALSPAFKAVAGGADSDFSPPNVIYASDSAGKYISCLTNASLESDIITILIPKSYDESDLHLAEAYARMYSDEYEILHFDSADVACFGYEDSEAIIPTARRIKFMEDPVIIYFPRAKDYDYLDGAFATSLDQSEADKIAFDNDFKRLDIDLISAGGCADKFMSDSSSQAMLYFVIIMSLGIYCLIILITTVMLDIALCRRDRGLSLIFGEGFVKRSLSLLLSIFLSLAFSCIGAVAICELIGFKEYLYIYLTAAAMLAFELAFALTAIGLNERKEGYIISSLKGGAL